MSTGIPMEERSGWEGAVERWWVSQSSAGQVYMAGIGILLASAVCTVLGSKSPLVDVGFMAGLACWAIGLVIEAYGWGRTRFNPTVLKTLATGVAAMVVLVATAGNDATLAAVTGQDPGSFKVAQRLLSVFATAQLACFLAAVAGLIGIPVLFLALMASLKKGAFNWEVLPRLLGYLFMVFAAWTNAADEGPLAALHRSIAAQAAYSLDMHEDRSCSPIEGDRVMRLNDDLVIVARPTDEGIAFRRVACKLTVQNEPLPSPRKHASAGASTP